MFENIYFDDKKSIFFIKYFTEDNVESNSFVEQGFEVSQIFDK